MSTLPDAQLREIARGMDAGARARVIGAYVCKRTNRRHKPGRAFERAAYRFDVLADYGAFRDLQRHRMLTLEWQALSPDHGYNVAESIEEAGGLDDWKRVMDASRDCYEQLAGAGRAQLEFVCAGLFCGLFHLFRIGQGVAVGDVLGHGAVQE